MEYRAAQTKLQILHSRLHYLLLMSVGLLIANVSLVWLVGWSFLHQKRTIVPTEISSSFTVSDTAVDASYLCQMAMFFVNERLNITPANINQSHNIILQYTDPLFYHEFIDILGKEKEAVVKQNISSTFYLEEIVPDTKKLSVEIKGSLMHWVGNLALAPVKKDYILKFSYRAGVLKVLYFADIAEAAAIEKPTEKSKVIGMEREVKNVN
ncbi:conjugal transfer pilus assembly protein TraE [Gammaproteobacteria bacterium]